MGPDENLDQVRQEVGQPGTLRPPPVRIELQGAKPINGLGVAGLVLGIGAAFVCWIPLVGLIAVPIAALGLLFAVLGLVVSLVGRKSGVGIPVSGCVVSIIALVIGLAAFNVVSGPLGAVQTHADRAREAARQQQVTRAEFEAIEIGMSYRDVVRTVGCEGQEESRVYVEGVSGIAPPSTIVSYRWQNPDFSTMNITFENDKANTKLQFGLK